MRWPSSTSPGYCESAPMCPQPPMLISWLCGQERGRHNTHTCDVPPAKFRDSVFGAGLEEVANAPLRLPLNSFPRADSMFIRHAQACLAGSGKQWWWQHWRYRGGCAYLPFPPEQLDQPGAECFPPCRHNALVAGWAPTIAVGPGACPTYHALYLSTCRGRSPPQTCPASIELKPTDPQSRLT